MDTTTAGIPVDLPIPTAKKPATRSSWCTWTVRRSIAAAARANGVLREPGEIQTWPTPRSASVESKAWLNTWLAVGSVTLGRLGGVLAGLDASSPRKAYGLSMATRTYRNDEIEVDGNGRMLLPTPLREYAQLGKKVVLIGQGKKFELWDEQTWSERMETWLGDGVDDELPAALAELTL